MWIKCDFENSLWVDFHIIMAEVLFFCYFCNVISVLMLIQCNQLFIECGSFFIGNRIYHWLFPNLTVQIFVKRCTKYTFCIRLYDDDDDVIVLFFAEVYAVDRVSVIQRHEQKKKVKQTRKKLKLYDKRSILVFKVILLIQLNKNNLP